VTVGIHWRGTRCTASFARQPRQLLSRRFFLLASFPPSLTDCSDDELPPVFEFFPIPSLVFESGGLPVYVLNQPPADEAWQTQRIHRQVFLPEGRPPANQR